MALLPWNENISVFMSIGFRINKFTLDSETLGVLDVNQIDGSEIIPDVSEFVKDISISRGRTDQLQQFNAGTATITLNNLDRRFDPTNEDSPYYDVETGRSGLTPRRRIVIYSGSDFGSPPIANIPIFAGSITDIDIQYKPQQLAASADNSTVTITASDDFVLLANTYINPEYEPVQALSGTRLFEVLGLPSVKFFGYEGYVDFINKGVAALGGSEFDPAYTVAAGTNALQYIQKINEAEQGYLFMGADGAMKFEERLVPKFQVAVSTFADDGTGIPYNSLSVMFGQEQLYNNIVVSDVSGAEFSLSDEDSIDNYGTSSFELSDTLLATSGGTEQLDLLAQNLLLRYKEPEYRFDKMTVTYNGLTTSEKRDLSNLELADIILITRTYAVGSPSSVSQRYSVESLNHRITPSSHQLEIGLAVAPIAFPLILDDVRFGTLSENNALDGEVGI